MLKITLVCLVVATCMVVHTEAHGRMMDPPNRGSVWRERGRADFPRAEFDGEWCGFTDINDERNIRNVTCGVCGPIYFNDPKAYNYVYKPAPKIWANTSSFERTGPFYKGDIVRTYQQGQMVTAKLRVRSKLRERTWV